MKLHSIKKKTLTFVLAMSLCAGGSFTVLAAEESAVKPVILCAAGGFWVWEKSSKA